MAALLAEARRREIRTSLDAWCDHALAPVGQTPARHHRLVCSWLERVAAGDVDRLMILAPPGSAKSTYATVLFPTWWFCRQPHTAIICASHTGDLAASFGRRVRNLVSANREELGYDLSEDSRAADKWHTDSGGEYLASGVGMAIAGRRADLAVIDDPFKKREDAERQGERDRVWNWYRGDLYNRLKPRARIVLIMTRWHEDDIGGRLIDEMRGGADQWQIVSLPALCEDPETDLMGRELGEPLWPDWEPLEALQRKRRVVGEREWISQYQQRPAPDSGILFQVERLGVVSSVPSPVVQTVRAWDLAATEQTGGRDPDWTVGVRMSRMQDGRFLVEDVVRMRGTPEEVERTLVRTALADGEEVPIDIPQDPGQAGKGQVAYLTRQLAGMRVRSSVETGSKETRAMPVASQVEQGNVLLLDGEWRQRFVNELAAFPYGSKDDQVDALSRAFSNLVVSTGAESMIEFYRRRAEGAATVRRLDREVEAQELVEKYRRVRRGAEPAAERMCSACGRPVGPSRMEDGVSVWHWPECPPAPAALEAA